MPLYVKSNDMGVCCYYYRGTFDIFVCPRFYSFTPVNQKESEQYKYYLFHISKNYNHRRERGRMFAVVEVEPPPDETDFLCPVPDVVVEIGRIGTGRNEHNNQGARLSAFFVTLPDPFRQFSTVGGITEHISPPQFCVSPSVSIV